MSDKLTQARETINRIDAQMAELFTERMKAAETVFEYKKEFGLPVCDPEREADVIEKNSALIEDETIRGYYVEYIKNLMCLSRAYQHLMQSGPGADCSKKESSLIHVAVNRSSCEENSYDIIVERGILARAGTQLNLNRRVLIVTDSGVPSEYAKTVADQSKNPVIITVPQGEASKSIGSFSALLEEMLKNGFSRKDCVVAVGGGVVGDLSGFAASAYMRGIDFYNIPTTLLSQIDSSIGGKTAINFGGIKNIVGAFYQPKKVLIDPDLLSTLPERQISNGLAEAVKMALTSDRELFRIFENESIEESLDEIIIRSLMIKKSIVEQDEKEAGIRKILNFGHTIGHGIESSVNMQELYHGECVALGLIPMCDEKIRPRVIEVLKKCNLYNLIDFDWDKISEIIFHDKKADGDSVYVTTVSEIGEYEITAMKCSQVIDTAQKALKG